MKTTQIISISFALLFSSIAIAGHHAHNHHAENTIVLEHTEARETPPGVQVGAGYLKITNTGKQDDKLISVTGDLAPVIQIHTMTVQDNVFKMEELKGGLVIPAGETVQLEAGGKHLMFMQLPKQLKAGEEYKVTLNFEKAGSIEAVFPVKKHKSDEHDHSEHHGHSKEHKTENHKEHSDKHKHH